MWPLLLPTAAAHLPHDEVVAAAPDPAGRVVVAMRASGSAPGAPWLLLESTGGAWEVASRPPTSGAVVALSWVGERLALLDSGGALWWGPTEWEEQAGPDGLPRDLAGDADGRALVATTAGLWRAADDGWEQLVDGSFALVHARDGHVAGVTTAGALWADGAWLPALDGAVDVSEDGAWAATGEAVYHHDGGWIACGALPVGEPEFAEEARVVHLAANGEELLVGTGQWVYRSTDGCASFVEERPYPDGASYGDGPGDITSAEDACTGVWLHGGMSVVTGYRGVTTESGAGWSPGRLVDGAFARGLAVDAGAWLSTSYGGGLIRSDDGLVTVDHAVGALRYPERFGRQVVGYGAGEVLYCGDLSCWRTGDGGATFTELDLPFAETGGLGRGAAAVFAFAEAGSGGSIARSLDGVAWEERAVGEGATRHVRAVILHGEAVLIARLMNPDAAFVSRDDGETWEAIVDDGEPLTTLLTWPEGEGRRLVRAGATVLWSDDDGGSWSAAGGGPASPAWIVGVDDVLVAADAAGVSWSSVDGGESWVEGAWVGAVAEVLPAVADGVIVAPTFRGLRWSADAGASWHDAPAWDALFAPDADLLCLPAGPDGCATATSLLLGVGDVLRFDTRAAALVYTGSGALVVTVDGVEVGQLPPGEELALPGEGWRVVTATAMEPVVVEAVYGRILGEALPVEAERPASRIDAVVAPTPEACGCAAEVGPAGLGAGLGCLVLAVRRRRPRWPRSRPSRPLRAAPRPGPASSPGSGGP